MGTDCRPGRDPLNSQVVVVVVQNTDRVNNPRSHLFLQRFSSSKSRHEFKNAIPFLTWLFFFGKESRHICVTHAHAWELAKWHEFVPVGEFTELYRAFSLLHFFCCEKERNVLNVTHSTSLEFYRKKKP